VFFVKNFVPLVVNNIEQGIINKEVEERKIADFNLSCINYT